MSVVLAACEPSVPPAPTTPPVVDVTATSDGPKEVAVPDVPSAEPEPRISDKGIAGLAPGKPLPAAFLEGDLAKRYVTRFYADAQPLEGFQFSQPPLIAYVDGGPFYDFGMSSPGAPPPEGMAAEAAKLARDGTLKVKMIFITDPSLRTEKKVGVGSTYSDLVARYEAADTMTLPGLFEEPSCIVRPQRDSPIWFFFASCKRGDEGVEIGADDKVIRVVIE